MSNNNYYNFQARWTLRYVLAAVGFLVLAAIEGMMMRYQLVDPEYLPKGHFYAIMNAHPIVGIYGYAYMAVMGAFYFLIPYLLKAKVYSQKLIIANFWLQSTGVLLAWLAGLLTHFNSLYTLYWPLPVSFDRVSNLGAVLFILGVAIFLFNILLFSYNLFATLIKRRPIEGEPQPKLYSFGHYIKAAFGLDYIFNRKKKIAERKEDKKLYDTLPVFVVSVARGSIDTVINAFVLITVGVLILVYAIPPLLGFATLNTEAVNALIYKNWFWWGLDMVADGNVLMYAAGTWYLLIPFLTGRKLYGAALVRTVILFDLLISMGVWSHHLMADAPQPTFLKIFSGQLITSGEIITITLSIFATLMTLYLARPIKFTPALKFILASMFGFLVGAISGITQANFGLNVVLHNTQWVIGTHAHTMLLLGLSPLLFGVVYALIPLLTGRDIKSKILVNIHLIFWIGGGILMNFSMGEAGLKGMLRRTLYPGGEFATEMNLAMIGGIGLIIGLLALFINLVHTLSLGSIFTLISPFKKYEDSKLEKVSA